MLLESITITNVRSIESVSFSLSKKVTVITGPNGTGKSAILEAIALALGCAPKRVDPMRVDRDGNKAKLLSVTIDLRHQQGEAPIFVAPGPTLRIEYTRQGDGIQQWRIGQRIRTRKETRAILSDIGLDLRGSIAVVAQQDALQLAQLSPAALSAAIEQAAGVKAFGEATAAAKKELISVNSEMLKLRTNISKIASISRLPTPEQANDARKYLELCETRSKWENMKRLVDDAVKMEQTEIKRLRREIKSFRTEDKLAKALRLRPDAVLCGDIKRTRKKIEEAKRSVPLQWRSTACVGNTLSFKDITTSLTWILVLSRVLSPAKLNILLSDTREEAVALARNQNSRVWALEALRVKERSEIGISGTVNLHQLVCVKLPIGCRLRNTEVVCEALRQRILQGLPMYGVPTPQQARELVAMGFDAATPDGTFYRPGRVDGGYVLEHSQLRSLIVSFQPMPELPSIKYEEAMRDLLNNTAGEIQVEIPQTRLATERLRKDLSDLGHPPVPRVPSSIVPLLEGMGGDPQLSVKEILDRGESGTLALQDRLKQLEKAAVTLREDVGRLSAKVSVAFTHTAKLIQDKFANSVQRCAPRLNAELNINAEEGKAWIEQDGNSVSNLSGGQKSLLAVCLSLAVVSVAAGACRLVILDEIDAALDDIAREGIRELIKEEFKDKQVIIVTHHAGMISDGWENLKVSKINGVTRIDPV